MEGVEKISSSIRGTSESPRHTWLTRYRCSLPGLAGFAGPRCTEPEVPRCGSRKRCDCKEKSNTAFESLLRKRRLGTRMPSIPPWGAAVAILRKKPRARKPFCAARCIITYWAHLGLWLTCSDSAGLHLGAVGVPPQPPCRCPQLWQGPRASARSYLKGPKPHVTGKRCTTVQAGGSS
jgi:hypothetical protein